MITYVLLCGFPPYYGTQDQVLKKLKQNVPVSFPSPEWDGISTQAKELIQTHMMNRCVTRDSNSTYHPSCFV